MVPHLTREVGLEGIATLTEPSRNWSRRTTYFAIARMTVPSLTSRALTALRSATAFEHAQLDRLSPLTRDGLDGEGYVAHVERVLGWMRPMEKALWQGPLTATLPVALAPSRRNVKSDWLAHDLASAGFSAQAITDLPDCPYITPPRDLAECFGMTYVMEGATLGGTFLLRTLADRLPNHSLVWLNGYGDNTGRLWKQFLRALDTYVVTERDITAAAQSAQYSFQSFRRWVIDGANQMQE